MNKPTILHIITSMELGGAQEVLNELIMGSRNRFNHRVFYLVGSNAYQSLNIPGVEVEKIRFKNFFSSIALLKQTIPSRSSCAKIIIQGWMYHGNFISLFLKLFAFPSNKLFFSIHNCSDRLKYNSLTGYICSIVCSAFSRIAVSTVFVSRSCLREHLTYYNSIVINNPLKKFDCLHIQSSADLQLNHLSDISKDSIIFLFIGRYHPIKNFNLLFSILDQLRKRGLKFYLVMAGSRIDSNNSQIVQSLNEFDLSNCVTLLGEIRDVKPLYRIANFTFLTSYAESFSNVLLESISCGTPFISTDVGIASDLKSEFSYVIPKEDFDIDSLVKFIKTTVSADYRAATNEFFKRIKDGYDIGRIIDAYTNLWSKGL